MSPAALSFSATRTVSFLVMAPAVVATGVAVATRAEMRMLHVGPYVEREAEDQRHGMEQSRAVVS
jgi:hypothetical protein